MLRRNRTGFLFAWLFVLLIVPAPAANAQVSLVLADASPAVQPPSWSLSNQNSQPVAYGGTLHDPIAALHAKVDSLQSQLDYLNTNDVNCGQQCQPVTGNRGFYGGAGVVFAKPHFKEAFQHSSTSVATGQQSLVPFDYDYEATPRAWLGYKRADGFGFRFSFWNLEAEGETRTNVADGLNIFGAHAVSIIFPANIFAAVPGETLQNTDSLTTQVFDYYGTYDTTIGGFDVTGGIGLRNARLEQRLNSVVLNGAGAPIRQLSWTRVYEGLGPSLKIDAKRRLGCSPFSIVTQAGGALLFGKKSLDRTVLGDQSPQPATPFLSLEEADEVIGIGEINFGLEWSQQLRSGYGLSVRGVYEGQLWAEAGAPTLGFLGFEGFGVLAELKR